jgi:hypothetical protein
VKSKCSISANPDESEAFELVELGRKSSTSELNHEENIITKHDVYTMEASNCFMQYDAYILYAADSEDDEKFAFEIKNKMEIEHFFKVKENPRGWTLFPHPYK